MNKKQSLVIIISIVVCIFSVLFIVYRNQDYTNKFSLTESEKLQVEKSLEKFKGIYLMNHKLSQFSKPQFEYALELISQSLAKAYSEERSEEKNDRTYEDFYALAKAQYNALAKVASELYKKPANQITNEEYLKVIDDHYPEIANEISKTTSSKKVKDLFEEELEG